MTRICSILALLIALAAPAFAQQTVTEPITGVRISVLPSTGDQNTVPAIRMADTAITQASALCNQAPVTGTQPVSIVNPNFLYFDDPFTTGRDCKIPFPTGLAEGSYRAVAQFLTAAASCDVGGVNRAPCVSDRSAVAIPPFTILNIRVAPAVPTGLINTK